MFPGPLFFSETRVFERAFAWGFVQTIVLFPLGRQTVLGPIHIFVAGLILVLRERKRREMKDSVKNDMSLFEIAWNLIRREEGSDEATARLMKFEKLMETRLGRYAKLGALHVMASGGTNVWGIDATRLSQSFRNFYDSKVSPAPDLEAGYLEPVASVSSGSGHGLF